MEALLSAFGINVRRAGRMGVQVFFWGPIGPFKRLEMHHACQEDWVGLILGPFNLQGGLFEDMLDKKPMLEAGMEGYFVVGPGSTPVVIGLVVPSIV